MAIAARATFLDYALLILTIKYLFNFGECDSGLVADGVFKQPEMKPDYEYALSQGSTIKPDCKLVYQEYLIGVQNFTRCEINNVNPFSLCLECKEQYSMTSSQYLELNSNPDYGACRTIYMMSDRVQIIPTVQENMDKMWRMSHCHRCYLHNGTIREMVSVYLNLYSKFNVCVKDTKEGDIPGNKSDVCIQCKEQYISLNAHFNGIYDADAGDVCMDIMHMMNYTRIKWASTYNCTQGSYDPTPVIIISCFVACTPLIFYVYLRITGKVRKAKLYNPKRLTSNIDGSSGTSSTPGTSLSSD